MPEYLLLFIVIFTLLGFVLSGNYMRQRVVALELPALVEEPAANSLTDEVAAFNPGEGRDAAYR